MARKTQQRNRRRKRSNTRLYLLVGLLMLAMAAYVVLPIIGKSKSSPTRTTTTTSSNNKSTNSKKPAATSRENIDFQKEGTLDFIKNGNVVKSVDIEVSDSEAEISQGLMYRQTMDDGQAMLFIFDRDKMQSFWMKNTYIPLDIIFVNSNLSVVSIGKNTQPLSQQNVLSEGPAMYVIEVPAGFTDAYNIQKGDTVTFTIDENKLY